MAFNSTDWIHATDGGAAYPTLQGWESAHDGDAPSTGQTCRAEIEGNPGDTLLTYFDGWQAGQNATTRVEITAKAGCENWGDAPTGTRAYLDQAVSFVQSSQDIYLDIFRIAFINVDIAMAFASGEVRVYHCYFSGGTYGILISGNATTYVAANKMIDCSPTHTYKGGIRQLSGDNYAWNNTIDGCGDGCFEASGTLELRNNVATGSNSEDFSSASDEQYNASEDATASHATSYDSETVTNLFEDYSSRDFTPKTTGNLYQNGTDQPTWFDTLTGGKDLAGNDYDADNPSIGCYEVAGGGSAAVTSGNFLESEIVTGGEEVVITLTDDTWIAAGTGPIGTTANTQALIDGIDGDVAGGTGWDAQVQSTLVPADDVARTSATVCTITLNAASYAISANETITVTIPAAVLTGGEEIVADATFAITNEAAGAAMPVIWHHLNKNIGR